MPNKRVIFAVLAAALLFGVAVSGCNRNREPRMASAERRDRRQRAHRDLDSGSTHRPAEVLSASVRRTSRRSDVPGYAGRPSMQPSATYYHDGIQVAQTFEPLPEPVPLYTLPPYQQSQQPMYAGEPYYAQPHQFAGYNEPIEVIHPTPELAMARAQLQSPPVVVPVSTQPVPTQYYAPVYHEPRPAPIPELEPVRYQRVAAGQHFEPLLPPPAPVPVMMSAAPAASGRQRVNAGNDMQRALAPLPQHAGNPGQGWVSSPTTAMRPHYR